jgi:hypothetical protein
MGRIFLVGDDELVELGEEQYATEDQLQELLARYPSLIPGDDISPDNPRRWLLIAREVGIPGEEDGGSRWSLDHLFVDQDGVPTLIEVKRSSDSRIRREVVGQMLDYAANGIAYWPVERLQSLFEQTCARSGSDPSLTLEEFTANDGAEDFWKAVKTNLQAGRIRLLFVADKIPVELQRVVEFLNTQMDPAEVFAVAIPRFAGGGMQTLVPRLIGQTVEARTRKSGVTAPARQWDEASVLTELERRKGAKARALAKQIIGWCDDKGLGTWFGKGSQEGSYFPVLEKGPNGYLSFAIWTYGAIEVQFQRMKDRPAFESEVDRKAFLTKLNQISAVSIPADAIGRRPSFNILALEDTSDLRQFFSALDWFIQHVEEFHG